ncbi:MAG TPA: hypothetical protein VFQ06_16325, partial [Nitrospira sp.]|nr:hypothetical protein [Nitrospira sp.]
PRIYIQRIRVSSSRDGTECFAWHGVQQKAWRIPRHDNIRESGTHLREFTENLRRSHWTGVHCATEVW